MTIKLMKIAMIGQKGIPAVSGGIERHVEEISKELTKQGHTVLVYARKWYCAQQKNRPNNANGKNTKLNQIATNPSAAKATTNPNNIKIIFTPTIYTKHLDAITHTFTSTIHALTQKPDIIHYHGVGPSLLSWIPRLLSPKTKIIATAHCLDRYHQKWSTAAKLVLRLGEWTAAKFAHTTIVVSKTLHAYYLNEFQKQTEYIPNGVPIKKYPGHGQIKSVWDLEPNKYLLMASRLVKHKGAHYLLEAWLFARKHYPILTNDYKLVIAGGAAWTNNYVKELYEIADDDDSIIFTNTQSGQILDELYANTALLIHPSENEGMPITVLQAMSYGRPVLVSDIAEHKEVITDSRFWFHNASIASLADKIIELLKNKRLLSAAGKHNQKVATINYNWNEIAKKTATIYELPANTSARTAVDKCYTPAQV